MERGQKLDSGGLHSDQGGPGGLERGSHGDGSAEVDDLERTSDRRRWLDHERETGAAPCSTETEEAVQGGAVDEHDAVEIDDERVVGGNGGLESSLEPADIREVELTGQRDERHARLAGIVVLEVVRRHGGRSAYARGEPVNRPEVSSARRQGTLAARMSNRASATERVTEFRVRVELPSDESAIVAVGGDADLHSAPELRDRLTDLMDEGVTWIVLDLSETTFVDSMALGVLLGTVKRLRTTGGRLDVVVPRPDIRRIFEITMLDRVFDLHASLEQALDGRVDGRGPA